MKDLNTIRHSLSHVMAACVKDIFKDVKFGIGPAIDNGFYYDFDLKDELKPEHLSQIEGRMIAMIHKGLPFEKRVLTKAEAQKFFVGQPYKLELIEELQDNEITIYTVGEFADLCRGSHVENTNELKNTGFKLVSVNGAYFKGSEKNKMLSRIYAYAFADKKELDAYVKQVEEAKARDHAKLGRELEYFITVDEIGKGLPVLLPRGAKAIQLMQRFVEDQEEKAGYLLTKTPFMAKSDLYKISGHWQHYKEGMFVLGDEKNDTEVFALRPMTCPFQFQTYLTKTRSYRDLPMRLNETSTLFRNESSGEMHGLIRMRQFTISEGHLACTPEQLEEEFKGCLVLAQKMLNTFRLDDSVSYRFSKWDENNKEKYIGTKEEWEAAQDTMRTILNSTDIKYTEADGEAAFYGPKLDIQIKNVHGKEDTIITIQIDFELARRFKMEYTDKDGKKKNPYIIHRTSLGCYERTLAYLIEKFAGALPFWLCLEQVGIVPVSEEFNSYANTVAETLQAAGVRAVVHNEDGSMGSKVFSITKYKTPFAVVVGSKEKEAGTVSVKSRDGKQAFGILLNTFTEICKDLNENKEIDLWEKFI